MSTITPTDTTRGTYCRHDSSSEERTMDADDGSQSLVSGTGTRRSLVASVLDLGAGGEKLG